MERVWRIIHKPTNRYMPAPRNSKGVYGTERGAKAGRTQLKKWLRPSRGEDIDDYDIKEYVLLSREEYDALIYPRITIRDNTIYGN